jgi:tetratricopeptide (TPR) repeat protein
MSKPLLALHELSLYNTGRLSAAQVTSAFSARKPLFDRLIKDVGAEKPRSRAQHHLLIGQRGMGKTMLLARIAAEIDQQTILRERFVPLVFAEEQYSVDRLSRFWLNCLDSLADALEREGNKAEVAHVDTLVAQLTATPRTSKNEHDFAREVLQALESASQALKRRLVLLVDNVQLVFERISAPEQHVLREVLMRAGAPILIGTCPSLPPQTQDYSAAFYDQFKTHFLGSLSEAEMRDLLLHLCDATGATEVRQRVLNYPARLSVLRQLTGGNPRTTQSLFLLYAQDFSPSVFADLENLLDRVTPLYKARFEELTEQQQVIASAIANYWHPLTAATLTQLCGLPATSLSGQLDRLEKLGTIERVSLHNESRYGYQLAERFFNIWFLMRSASRRQRREVEYLTRFLENFYAPEERSRVALGLMADHDISADRYLWCLALSDSVQEAHTAQDLLRHVQQLALKMREHSAALREVVDFDALPRSTLNFAERRKKLMALVPADAGVSAEAFADKLLGSLGELYWEPRTTDQLVGSAAILTMQRISELLERAKNINATFSDLLDPSAIAWLTERMRRGLLDNPFEISEWDRTIQVADRKEQLELVCCTIPIEISQNLKPESLARIREHLAPRPEETDDALWRVWGGRLRRLKQLDEAEKAFRAALAISQHDAIAWSGLAGVLAELMRFDEAEAAARTAHELLRFNMFTLVLADVLMQQKKYAEARDFYRLVKNNEQDQTFANEAAIRLGVIEQFQGRYLAAERIFLDCTELAPNEAWMHLGDLYTHHLCRPIDADLAYEKLNSAASRFARVTLQRDRLGQLGKAKQLFAEIPEHMRNRFRADIVLHEVLFAAYDENWGIASATLSPWLTQTAVLNKENLARLSKVSAVLLHLNYGAALLQLINDTDDLAKRLGPWLYALQAHCQDDKRALQNIAPEVRSAAEVIFDAIENQRKLLPDKARRFPPDQANRQRRATKRPSANG